MREHVAGIKTSLVRALEELREQDQGAPPAAAAPG
jgi:hypothetical protein